MSDGYRNGAFALGLVTGIGLVLNLILWLGYLAQDKVTPQDAENQSDQNDGETSFWWWRWTGDLVSSSDTLAQWIMAAVTIVATVVLLLTLRSANKTNAAAVIATEATLEANEIMRREQRPWLKISVGLDGGLRKKDDEVRAAIIVIIENIGPMPAVYSKLLSVEILCELEVFKSKDAGGVDKAIEQSQRRLNSETFGRSIIFPREVKKSRHSISVPPLNDSPDKRYSKPLVLVACPYMSVAGGDLYHTAIYRCIVRGTEDNHVSALMIDFDNLEETNKNIGIANSIIADRIK